MQFRVSSIFCTHCINVYSCEQIKGSFLCNTMTRNSIEPMMENDVIRNYSKYFI